MRHEDIPEVNNPKIRFPVLEGDKLMHPAHRSEGKVLSCNDYNSRRLFISRSSRTWFLKEQKNVILKGPWLEFYR